MSASNVTMKKKPLVDPDTKDVLREQAKSVGDNISELGALGKEAAGEVADTARERALEMKADAEAKVGDFEDQIVRYVREQPVKSVLIAAGVGVIASMWMRRG